MSAFKITMTFGDNAHFSRKAGTIHKAFGFVLGRESRMFCVLGIKGVTRVKMWVGTLLVCINEVNDMYMLKAGWIMIKC